MQLDNAVKHAIEKPPRLVLGSLAAVLLAGTPLPGQNSSRHQDALKTAINGPHRIAIDAKGNLYVSEDYGYRIIRISASDHRLEVVAGNGKKCCRVEDVRLSNRLFTTWKA
jgi:hypothetical protein